MTLSIVLISKQELLKSFLLHILFLLEEFCAKASLK